MFRLLLVVVGFVAAATWIDASWSPDQRALTLRVRRTAEILDTVRDRSRDLGRRAVNAARERLEPVAAAPPASPKAEGGETRERLTREERERLDRLVVEKTRER